MLIIFLGLAFTLHIINRKGILMLSLKKSHYPLIPVLIHVLTDFIQNVKETGLATIETVVFKYSKTLVLKHQFSNFSCSF